MLDDLSQIYLSLAEYAENSKARKEALQKRASHIEGVKFGMVKYAFDSRRIDQENDYNPRRGLQNYNRSEAFITHAMTSKLLSFNKLKQILEELKAQYGKSSSWHDSYCRVLLNTIYRALRVNEQDGDFSENQPSVGSLDYLEELLHVRYRLNLADMSTLSDDDLKRILLSKDEFQATDVNNIYEVTKKDVASQPADALIEKLFGGVRATKENPEVERTVTITIKDKFVG